MGAKVEIIWGDNVDVLVVSDGVKEPVRVGDINVGLRSAAVKLLDANTAQFVNVDGVAGDTILEPEFPKLVS